MHASQTYPTPSEPDPLPTASLGTVLASAGSLLWPPLVPAVVCLAAVVCFVVWIQTLRVLRGPRAAQPGWSRLTILGLLAGVGWGAAWGVGPFFLDGRSIILAAFSVGVWRVSRRVLLPEGGHGP